MLSSVRRGDGEHWYIAGGVLGARKARGPFTLPQPPGVRDFANRFIGYAGKIFLVPLFTSCLVSLQLTALVLQVSIDSSGELVQDITAKLARR